MITKRIRSAVFAAVVAAVTVGAIGCSPAAATPDPGAALAVKRIGAAPIEAAHPTTQPNVARDPSIVPPPITRTEPTTVEFTLTAKEVTAELADGVTYDFWTFDGTVPGPMLRVMEGDTVKVTLVNPKENKVGHNVDLHAVNGPGGGAAVLNANPGETRC
ncbi:MAG: multicopper oxidase domain-containing protein [Chloroflexi bacterium]|nr:multicopper oxidase domain-containing protein [Chloroflexota bacterium]